MNVINNSLRDALTSLSLSLFLSHTHHNVCHIYCMTLKCFMSLALMIRNTAQWQSFFFWIFIGKTQSYGKAEVLLEKSIKEEKIIESVWTEDLRTRTCVCVPFMFVLVSSSYIDIFLHWLHIFQQTAKKERTTKRLFCWINLMNHFCTFEFFINFSRPRITSAYRSVCLGHHPYNTAHRVRSNVMSSENFLLLFIVGVKNHYFVSWA